MLDAWAARCQSSGDPQEGSSLVSRGLTNCFLGGIFFFFFLEVSKCFSGVDLTPAWTVLAVIFVLNDLFLCLGFCKSLTCLNHWVNGIFGGILKHERWVAQLVQVKAAERGRGLRAVLTEWICFDLDEKVLGCVSNSFNSHRLPQLTRRTWHPMTLPPRRTQQAN